MQQQSKTRMKPRQNLPLSHARLLAVLDYDPASGVFRWKMQLSPRGLVGAVTGVRRNPAGYCFVWIDGVSYLAHRLAWFYVTGAWPEHCIDHLNGLRHDNRFVNLRDVPQLWNRQNSSVAGRNNKVGLLGVTRTANGQRFIARITHAGRRNEYLGTFDTAEAAHTAFMQAKCRLHPGARGVR